MEVSQEPQTTEVSTNDQIYSDLVRVLSSSNFVSSTAAWMQSPAGSLFTEHGISCVICHRRQIHQTRLNISAYVNGIQDVEGVALSAILRHLRHVPSSIVRQALIELLEEGHALTTIDDEHFAIL